MHLSIHSDSDAANRAATEHLAHWLAESTVRSVMVAAGNSPLELYRRMGGAGVALSHLELFALDEYLGVPLEEPRTCANLLRRAVADAWDIPADRFHVISSLERDALASVREHERLIALAGGIDVIILGLGQNGHLGFNEPGSAEDSTGRLVDLEAISTEANRKWFDGDFAPSRGVTVGLRTILAARRVFILAYGAHKAASVTAMVEGPRGPQCPASFLQGHPHTRVFLDEGAAAGLRRTR